MNLRLAGTTGNIPARTDRTTSAVLQDGIGIRHAQVNLRVVAVGAGIDDAHGGGGGMIQDQKRRQRM